MPNDHTPRQGAAGRPGSSGRAADSVRNGAQARTTGDPISTYPSDSALTPRKGYEGRQTPTGLTPDVPAPNTVEPIATRATPRPDLSAPK